MLTLQTFAERLAWWLALLVVGTFLLVGVLTLADILLPGSPLGLDSLVQRTAFMPH
jgi:hypothetical protein